MKAIQVWSPFQPMMRAALLAAVGLTLSFGVPRATFAACVGGTGNGTIEPGEDCDDGSQNGTANSCCSTTCTGTGKYPDVIVGDLPDKTGPYRVSGIPITAFAIGTTSCNLGTCWLNWFSSIAEHPVIGQNMYRLKQGRFEHIGQAWLKHGFTALQGTVCSNSCNSAPNGQHLGINCSDPYTASLNDDQNRMGPKSHVDASSGVYTYRDSQLPETGNAIIKLLLVHNEDLDPRAPRTTSKDSTSPTTTRRRRGTATTGPTGRSMCRAHRAPASTTSA